MMVTGGPTEPNSWYEDGGDASRGGLCFLLATFTFISSENEALLCHSCPNLVGIWKEGRVAGMAYCVTLHE